MVDNTDRRKQKYRRKSLSQRHCVTWTDLGSNPILRGERPTTNRLNHETAHGIRCTSSNDVWVQLTSHEEDYLTNTKLLRLCRQTVAVCCETRTIVLQTCTRNAEICMFQMVLRMSATGLRYQVNVSFFFSVAKAASSDWLSGVPTCWEIQRSLISLFLAQSFLIGVRHFRLRSCGMLLSVHL